MVFRLWRRNLEKEAIEALNNLNTFHDEVGKNFMACLNWLHEYACSRTYGLGKIMIK